MSILEKAIAEQKAAEEKAKKLAEFIAAQEAANRLAKELNLVSAVDGTATPAAKAEVVLDPRQENKKRPGINGDQVRSLVRGYLSQVPAMHTSEILERLESDGIQIAAKNKVIAVSQALGKHSDFVASRKVGWSLSSDSQKGESPAPTGLSGATNAQSNGLL